MNTPVYDFLRSYADSGTVRMHMPGHKGNGPLGAEALDLTEISGADELFAPEGIIAESEKNASALFGCETLYSAEGSSLCIRAMLHLAVLHAKRLGRPPVIAAARNVHKTFLTAAALLDFDIRFIQPESAGLLSCRVTADDIASACADGKVTAVYLTSPDYPGNLSDIRAAADFCHANGLLLLTDCAHGAYLHFLREPCAPADLGADFSCSSAHKTLPVLTGGAYLHIGASAPGFLRKQARAALALFASTSPSYLILASLDLCNRWLSEHSRCIPEAADAVAQTRAALRRQGIDTAGDEPLKLTLCPKSYGYTGTETADFLRKHGIECEFSDADFTVLMPGSETAAEGLARVTQCLSSLRRRTPLREMPPPLPRPERVCSVREAVFSLSETVPAEQAEGRICAEWNLHCPPAVPIVMCGERIDADVLKCFAYCQIREIAVLAKS